MEEGIRRISRSAGDLRAQIWNQLELPRRRNVAQSAEIPESRNESGRLWRPRRPAVALVAARDVAHDLESPDSVLAGNSGSEPELRKGNPVFGRPPVLVHARRDFPDRVPID